MRRKIAAFLLAACCAFRGAERQAIIPKNGVPPIGPYSAGVFAGDYLYVSGQGAKRLDGTMPATFQAQVQRTLENVKTVVEAAGLSMKNVVYMQVYREDMSQFQAMNHVYAGYFPNVPPARATLGVAKLPGGTTVEINAVAVRNLAEKKAVQVSGRVLDEPISAGILTNDRLFISALRARPMAAQEEVEAALEAMKSVVEAVGLTLENVVFVNPYLARISHRAAAKRKNTAPESFFEDSWSAVRFTGGKNGQAACWNESNPEEKAFLFIFRVSPCASS